MTTLTKIGNSQGIRIPKHLIEQAHLQNNNLELKIVKDGLLIHPIEKEKRKNWESQIEKILFLGKDESLDQAMLNDSDLDDWEW